MIGDFWSYRKQSKQAMSFSLLGERIRGQNCTFEEMA
jgi:hypothetical protein